MKKKFKTKDIIIFIAVIVVGIIATFVFRVNFSSKVGTPYEDTMPISDFARLVNSNEPRAWFYVYNKHEEKYAGLQPDDTVSRIYIAKSGKAEVYVDTQLSTTLADFEGLSPLAIVQRIESNNVAGHNYVKQETEYLFTALPDTAYEKLDISIKPLNGKTDDYTFIQTVPDSEIVTNMKVSTLTFAGYYHQSSSSDRFLKYQALGLITPIEPEDETEMTP